MAEDESKAPDGEDEAPPPTPFDSPWFVPVLLWGMALWFGYDIVTNAEAYQEWPNFNRGGLAVSTVAAAYFSWKAVRERRAEREADGSGGD